MIPLVDIPGLAGVAPPLWPMGIGAGRPAGMTHDDGSWRVDFRWDDAGRLAAVTLATADHPVHERHAYVWGDHLERILRFDDEERDVFGDDWESASVWRWADDLPVEIRTLRPHGRAEGPRDEWTWSNDARSVQITETSRFGVRSRRTVAFDAAGRMVHSETHRAVDDAHLVVDVEWSLDGRLLSARELSGPGLSAEHVVGFRWDDRGRLLAQTSSSLPERDLWVYRYEDGA